MGEAVLLTFQASNSCRSRHTAFAALAVLAAAFPAGALAEDSKPGVAIEQVEERVVAARVDGHPIYVDEVQRRIARVVGDRKIEPEARPALEAETLSHLVDRQLAIRFLQRRNLAASEQDLEAEMDKLERQLAQQEVTLEEFLNRTGQSRDSLKENYRWELSWRRYLERNLNEENLQRFFQRHQREFDGTELRVAHILFKPAKEYDRDALKKTLEIAEEVRTAIAGGKLTFAEAAKKHSVSPTAAEGGDIGFIGRRGPMPEPFSAAAFALNEGEVTPPVVTSFGVHLIQLLEAKPGQGTWKDSRRDLEQAVTAYLFAWVANQQRPHSHVEYTDALPHFKPATKQLADESSN
jgi:parvulin-like peptidyl-prolyl isomerase